MTKLTRKLLLSIMAVAFAFITLGATTFAWFTLSTKAEVQEFEVEVSAGAGIEISADGFTYTNSLTPAQIYDGISKRGKTRILDDLTTSDGFNFLTISENSNQLSFDIEADSGWVEFDLYFRSPEPNVQVYMLDSSYIKSGGLDWTSDAQFLYKQSSLLLVNQNKHLYAANALRLSTQEWRFDDIFIDPTEDEDHNAALIFELDPTFGATDFENQRLDTTIVADYGSVAYYNAKYPLTPITGANITAANVNLPQKVLSNVVVDEEVENPDYVAEGAEPQYLSVSNLVNSNYLNTNKINASSYEDNNVATLGSLSGIYYYGRITVRAWLEGWDPDMYNAIMSDKIQIYLNFGAHSPSALMDLTLELSSEDILVDGETEIMPTLTGEPTEYGNPTYLFESTNTDIVTVTSAGLVTGVKVGSTYIKVWLDEYPNISETILVTVVDTTPQG